MLGKHRGSTHARARIAAIAAAAALAVAAMPSASLAAATPAASAVGTTLSTSAATEAVGATGVAGRGTVTIEAASDGAAHTYRAFKVLEGNASADRLRLSNVSLGTDMGDAFWRALESTPEWREDGPATGYGAQDAAEWLSKHMQEDATGAFAAELASAALSSGAKAQGSFSTGSAHGLDGEGLYLFASADAQPILAIAGDAPLDVKTKSTLPTVETVVRTGDGGEWGQTADASVGRDLQFRTTFSPASNIRAYGKYPVKLHIGFAPRFAYREGTARVVLVDADGGETDVTDKVAVENEGGDLVVSTDDLKGLAKGAGLAVGDVKGLRVYSAAALLEGAGTGTANANQVETAAECPLSPASDLISDVPATAAECTVNVRTYKVEIEKRDAETGDALDGAGWTVSDLLDGLKLDGSEWTEEGSEVSGDGSVAEAAGLGPGTYSIEETTAPAGYEKADDAVMTIDADEGDDGSVTVTCTAQGDAARVESVDSESGEIHVTVDDEKSPQEAGLAGPFSAFDKTGDGRGPLALLLAALAAAAGAYGARKRRQAGTEEPRYR